MISQNKRRQRADNRQDVHDQVKISNHETTNFQIEAPQEFFESHFYAVQRINEDCRTNAQNSLFFLQKITGGKSLIVLKTFSKSEIYLKNSKNIHLCVVLCVLFPAILAMVFPLQINT